MKTLKNIWYALTSPEAYRDFMNYKTRNLLLHVFVLVFASSFITMGIPAAQFMASGGFGRLLEEEIPEFTASSENGFWIEKPVEIDEYNFLIKADSNVVREDIRDLDGQYGSYDFVIMVDKEQIYVKAPGMQELSARFDEMPGFSFSKANILEYTPVMYMSAVWVLVLAFLMDYGYYFLSAFVVSFGSGVLASFMKMRLGSKKLFRMSVYAGTLSYLLGVIQVLTGITIPSFSFFSLIISTGYMYFAIRDYRDSGIEELPPEKFGREG